jgi:hypothetical protein
MEKSLRCAILLIFLTVSVPVHSDSISSWWDNLDKLNGFRFSLKIGGWNFWHTNDAEYVYSDAIGSLFSGEEGRLYNYPMIGAGVRWSPWKFLLINIVVSTSRISLGAGIGFPFPIGGNGFNITPWAAADFTLTNGFVPALSYEGGIDLFFSRFLIIGLDFCFSGNQPFYNDKGWKSINYGVSYGFKL